MSLRPPAHPVAVWSAPRLAALWALLLAALALRLWHIRQGLPDFVEEAIPFRRALAMWGWASGNADWNPHFFHYPSLSLYLHHLLQHAHVAWGLATGQFANANDYYVRYRTDPSSMVVLARLLEVTADAATIVGVASLGERVHRGAGLLAAALVAFAPVMIMTSRSIYADTLMTALAVWSVERMLAYRERGGGWRLAATLVLVGLAAGTKYPAVLLMVPLGWVLLERHRGRAVPIGSAAFAAIATVGLATSPFILVELPTFLRDVAFVRQLPVEGQLGNLEDRAFLFHFGHLGQDLGWVAVALLVLSLLLLVRRRPSRSDAAVLWLTLLAFALPISLARITAERYLVPVILVAAALIGITAMVVTGRLPSAWKGPARLVMVIVLLLPPLLGGVRAGASGSDDTQLEARRWCQERLSSNDLMIQESHGVSLLTRAALERARDERPLRLASAPIRERFLAQPAFRIVTLPLSVAGRCVSRVRVPDGPLVEVPIFAHSADFNRVFYDPRLLIGVDYLLTSSAVRGRFEADPLRYAVAGEFYRLLDGSAQVVARFAQHRGVVGPTITIYHLGAHMDSLIIVRYGRPELFWWAEQIPTAYREQAEKLLRPAGRPHVTEAVDRDGRSALWVTSLREVFEEKVHLFGSQMVDELTTLGECDQAARLAAANLAVAPAHLEDCLAFTACSGRLANWAQARAVVERAIAATAPDAPGIPYLNLEHARILMHVAEPARARQELERVLDAAGSNAELVAAARLGLEALKKPHPAAAGDGR